MTTNRDELESLLFDWESGLLDDQAIERVRDILRNDAQARAHYIEWQILGAAMHLEADEGMGLPLPITPDEVPVTERGMTPIEARRFSLSSWIAVAASLMVCVLGGWLVGLHVTGVAPDRAPSVASGSVPRDPSDEATSHGIALLTRLVDVTWQAGQQVADVGDALPPGRFVLQSGLAQIEFFCGATVVVEGPAELELATATLARVRSGRVRAHVPPAARGFALEADDLKIVDLGTDFGVSVTSDGAGVQVFDGEVELHRASEQKRLLTAGQAVLRTAEGAIRASESAPDSFVDIADLEARAQLQRAARYGRWREWSSKLQEDPRVITYYAFNRPGDWHRRLLSDKGPRNSELDGAIVGAREVEGRWGAKRALEFKQPADRVRIQIPGEFNSLTFACWARIDSLDRWFNSLFLTDGYDKGEPHWQILDTGQLYFSVRPADPGVAAPLDFKALSPVCWDPSLNGRWIHLAVTCDVPTRTIVHYLNGTVLSRHEVPEVQMPSVTRIGTASIGNWSLPTLPDAEFAIRNLNGRIDEFVVLAAALSEDEIKEMYEVGKP